MQGSARNPPEGGGAFSRGARRGSLLPVDTGHQEARQGFPGLEADEAPDLRPVDEDHQGGYTPDPKRIGGAAVKVEIQAGEVRHAVQFLGHPLKDGGLGAAGRAP